MAVVWPTEPLSQVPGDKEEGWSGVYQTGRAYSTFGMTVAVKR